MNLKKIIITAAAAANAVSVAAFIALTAVGSSMAKSQSYNDAARRWDPEGGYIQVSCFLAEDAGFTTDMAGGVRASVLETLKNINITPEAGKELIPEAYSTAAGQMTLRSDTTGRTEAEVTAVGGNFFLFRDFQLLNGAFFSPSDIMQDGAVIDRSAAWALYGSTNIAGMNIYINGTKFYIAGVIEDPMTKAEKKTAGELPRVYISYEGLTLVNGGSDNEGMDNMGGMGNGGSGGKSHGKISCYECLVPDPVENYGLNAVKDYFQGYNGKCTVVDNTTRFDPSVRAKAFKRLSDYAVVKNSVVYPYWENASRIVEFKLTSVYFYRRLTYIIPIITLLVIIGILWKAGGRLFRKIKDGIVDGVTRFFYYRKIRRGSDE